MERKKQGKDWLERVYLTVFLGDNLLTALGLYTLFTPVFAYYTWFYNYHTLYALGLMGQAYMANLPYLITSY